MQNGADHRWQYGACAFHARYLGLKIHTLRFYNHFRFSAATMVKQKLLYVTLYVHCLSCYNRAGVCLLRGTDWVFKFRVMSALNPSNSGYEIFKLFYCSEIYTGTKLLLLFVFTCACVREWLSVHSQKKLDYQLLKPSQIFTLKFLISLS